MTLDRLRQLLSPLRPVIGPILRPFRSALRRIRAAMAPPPARPYRLHDLTMNHALSREEHQYCVSLVNTLQALYDDAPDYLTRKGLDPGIFLPQGEWASIIPSAGLKNFGIE